jgi:hypothetical protein
MMPLLGMRKNWGKRQDLLDVGFTFFLLQEKLNREAIDRHIQMSNFLPFFNWLCKNLKKIVL